LNEYLRETVAGDATAISPVSKRSVTCSGIAIRSPFVNVKILLSSITEFIDSIQTASIYSKIKFDQ
jgi:C4-dicarboxylate transporter